VTATTAGSVSATTAGSVTATTAGSVTATTAGSVTATTAGSVTALGATAQGAASFTLKPTVARDSPVISGILMAPTAPVRRALEPLSEGRFGVRFTADAEFRELLEEVGALASHREPAGDLLSLMKRGLVAYRRELQKERFGVGRKPRRVRSKSVEHTESARRSRHVPAAVARAVYLRDGGGCTFYSEDGRRCGARRFLELDHVTPWAVGGETKLENLRLRCRAHNQCSARSYFGADFIRARLAARPRRAGSPPDPEWTPLISEQWRVGDHLVAWFSDPDARSWGRCLVVATLRKVRVVRAGSADPL